MLEANLEIFVQNSVLDAAGGEVTCRAADHPASEVSEESNQVKHPYGVSSWSLLTELSNHLEIGFSAFEWGKKA